MRKATANIIKCLLLLAVTVYLTFAFVLATLNPFEWGEDVRFLAVMVFYVVSVVAYLVNSEKGEKSWRVICPSVFFLHLYLNSTDLITDPPYGVRKNERW